MNESDLPRQVITTFELLEIQYFITGSFASIAHGEPRYTNDIDIVADIPFGKIGRIVAAFPEPDFYLSESAVRQAVAKRFQFNIVHIPSGLKMPFALSRRGHGFRAPAAPHGDRLSDSFSPFPKWIENLCRRTHL